MLNSARFLVGIFLGSIFLIPLYSEAASLYIDPAISTLNRGDSAKMVLRLDTDEAAEECVNAVDGVVTYSDNIEPVDVSIGNSIFNMWVERPVINKENKTITFAGGIPNGYCGRVQGDPRLTNIIAEIVFRSPGFSVGAGSNVENTATVDFTSSSTAYLNDGFGTKADLNLYGAKIELNKSAGATMINPWKDEIEADDILPEKFSISLQKDDKAFSGKYYIVFSTTDKQTGIDHYEVMEEPLTQFGSFQWGRADAPWLMVKQPPVHVLKDQSLNSIIRVKAIDKAGNEYIATYIPDDSLRTFSRSEFLVYGFGIAGLIIIIIVGLAVFTYVKKKRRSKTDDRVDIEDDSDANNLEE
ncbi:hypothetical protein H6784_00505 [Candidatus Nomurabacteria bacterium]|nr:hypothetical protein [Candidatus Kaiserbacteria bacterium]MCB9813874.1 hypothetical protein [Candidatus Nomurabacteria bacterium]